MDFSELTSEVKRALIEELDLRGRSEQDLDAKAPLFGDGLGLDSLDALQLAMALEERFGVKIPEGDEGRRIFASIDAIVAHIVASRGK